MSLVALTNGYPSLFYSHKIIVASYLYIFQLDLRGCLLPPVVCCGFTLFNIKICYCFQLNYKYLIENRKQYFSNIKRGTNILLFSHYNYIKINITNERIESNYLKTIFFIFINMGVRTSLRTPRLISWILRLTTI